MRFVYEMKLGRKIVVAFFYHSAQVRNKMQLRIPDLEFLPLVQDFALAPLQITAVNDHNIRTGVQLPLFPFDLHLDSICEFRTPVDRMYLLNLRSLSRHLREYRNTHGQGKQ